jgi:uncharacterized protein (TIGR00369 family)
MKFPVKIPFIQSIGIELLRCEAGEAELAIGMREDLRNGWGVMHGGVTMTLLDVAMAHAARSPGQPVADEHRGVVTIEMKTSFMRAAAGRLTARGKLLQRTVSMAFCEASAFDEAGALVAHATGTFKYLHGLPAGGRKIQRPDASD